MKKRCVAAVLCALMIFSSLLLPARADEVVYFVAVEESVLPLSDATMPFWSNGYLYVTTSVFSGASRDSLGVSAVNNTVKRVTVLDYKRQPLLFYWDKGYAEDNDGNTFSPGAIVRGSTVFLPAAIVANYFGVQYSVTEVPHGYLVWLRGGDFGMSAKSFANAATYNMEDRYNAYVKAKQPDTTEPDGSLTPVQPDPDDPAKPTGTRIHLCLEAEDDADAMMNVISRSLGFVTFFCTPEWMERQGDLLRRMVASGHSVGIIVDASASDAEAQLRRGNAALFEATCSMTRLVRVRGGDAAARRALERQGWCLMNTSIDYSGYPLSGGTNADALMTRVQARRGDLSVWLGSSASGAGVRAFLSKARTAGYYCRALREVD